MTWDNLYTRWEQNINAEYILPTLDSFLDRHIIIDTQKAIPIKIGINGDVYKLKKLKK